MKKVKYDFPHFNPQKLHKKNVDRLAVNRIPPESYVLDIGCATGYIGEYLIKKKQCTVIGVDNAKAEARIAQKRISGVIQKDIEDKTIISDLKRYTSKEKFDVILLMSVIEHVKNPMEVIRHLRPFLKNNGIFVVSTPNIAHWTMRLSLLNGKFDYTEYGILDNTHLHFFTPRTFKELFIQNQLEIKDYAIDSVGGGYPKISDALSHLFPSPFTYQMVIVASKNEV